MKRQIKDCYEKMKRVAIYLMFCRGLILDVGCQYGSFKNKAIIGVDIDRWNLEKCHYENRICCNANFLPFKPKIFDTVISVGSFYFFRHALKELKQAGRRVIIVETIRNKKRLHWCSLLELLALGKPRLFFFHSLVIEAGSP